MKSKIDKINDAVERKLNYESRSAQEQLDILDKRLGKDIGAKKEREKLLKRIKS